jgi:hypothetical protein
MKKLVFLTMMIFAAGTVIMAGNVVKKGNTQTELGKYTISKTADFVEVDGKALPTYVISYENSDIQVKVAVDKDSKGKFKNFVVLGDDLNVMYHCENIYFGAKKLDKKYVNSGIEGTSSSLNVTEYYNQKVITRSNPTDRDCLGLIACYYPKLVNDYKTAFALK